jgi:hypothetical protein
VSQSSAYDDHRVVKHDGHIPSVADMQQAKYFQELLDEHHSQTLREISDKTAALTLSQTGNDTSAKSRLQRELAVAYREQAELDRLCDSLRMRLAADVVQVDNVNRPFEIVMTRRRAGWRMEIPEFDVVLVNIHSRAELEVVGRSIISAITGLPIAQIRVRSRLGRQAHRRSRQ